MAAPPQKKGRQSKMWNPYKNLLLARARESFSAQLKSSNNNISLKFGVKYRIRGEDFIVFENSKTRLIMA